MNNRDDDEQLEFDQDFGGARERREPAFGSFANETPADKPDDNAQEELVEEAYSANYPDDADDFQLDGDLAEADDDDWLAEEKSETEIELIWGEEENAEQDEPSEDEEDYDEPNPFDPPESSLPPLSNTADLASEPSWTEDPEEAEEWLAEEAEDEESSGPEWPLGLIAVAVVALLLLGAGGYGVMQQRAEAEDEIRELRAALATTVSTEEASSSREALREIEDRNQALQASVTSLQLENRQLRDTVAGLEAQLEVQQDAVARAEAATAAAEKAARAAAKPAPKPAAPAPKPAAAPKPAPATSGSWFVNFSSYSQRATAEAWQRKLAPASGKVMVVEASRDGSTLYRVRVVGLGSRDSAEQVARQLEREHGVSKLWVGQQ